ncbi:MAG: RES family NAD+ phosphorylase [Actinobacteria bacterium]|nr:RES family NAD+ phosphorylase [Actinomycetota bacterium]
MAPDPNPEPVEFDDVAFRYSNYDTPFWARPNSESGRWHSAGDEPTQYLSTTVEGAWAELIRTAEISSEPEVALIRMPMWAAQVHPKRLADYRTFERAAAAGFPPDALVDEDYSRCQAEGRRLRAAGFQGVLSPSAAPPGGTNLTIFGLRIALSWNVRPVLASSIPATEIAVGFPAQGIVDRVRQRRAPHTSLEAYIQRARRLGG